MLTTLVATTSTPSYQEAISIYNHLGDRCNLAEAHRNLGDAEAARGQTVSAGAAWRNALEIFTDLGYQDADAIRERLERLNEPSGYVRAATSGK